MNGKGMKMIALVLVALLGVAPAGAQETTRTEVKITDAVPGHPGVTYGALLQQIMPDLAPSDGGKSEIWATPKIEGLLDPDGLPDEGGSASFANLYTLEMKDGGRPVLVVMAPDLSGNAFLALVAAFDMSAATPKLIDYVNAAMDRITSLGTTVNLAEGTDGITITGWHNNSNENYENVQVLMLQKEKLASVMYAGTYSLLVCGMDMKQVGELMPEPDDGKPYAALVYTVTQTVTRPEEDCDDDGMERLPTGVMTARHVFRWDEAAAKFAATSHNSDQLLGPE